MKLLWILTLSLYPVFTSFSQAPVQVIRGHVFDEVSKEPLSGAQVFLKDTDPLIGAVTDENGDFIIPEVTVGRYVLIIQFVGYATYSEDLLVKAGGDPIVQVGLTPAMEELELVTITDKPFTVAPGTTNRKVTIEQTTRFAANYQDPARVMTSFPGVIVQNDQNNNMVINGKSANGLLWRVEGLDVVNPNHLSNAGTFTDRPTQNGGGVNILSTQMLGSSTLVSLPFSADYGNAYAGVMDMSFREGNKFENEFTAQASLIGLDIAAEGPIKKEESSFLANYRYSTVGLLSEMGLDFGGEEIKFQDLAFKLNFDHKDGGNLSVFAFGGKSSNDFFGEQDTTLWNYDRDSTKIIYGSEMYAVGFNEVRSLTSKTSLKLGAIFSEVNNGRTTHSISRDKVESLAEEFSSTNQMLSAKAELSTRLSPRSTLQTGIMVNYYNNSLFARSPYLNPWITADGEEKGVMYQPYAQYMIQLSKRFSAEGGLRYMHYTYNNSAAFLPNIRGNYNLSDKTSLFVNAGISAQKQDFIVYIPNSMNQSLPMTRIRHISLGSHHTFSRSLLTAEAFYQFLDNIPIHADFPSSYSVFNDINEITNATLTEDGTAEIYGLNASMEQPFNSGFYYILSGAVYDSKYKGSDGVKRDSRYNGKYSFSASTGMEFLKQKQSGAVRTLSLDLRFLYAGGFRAAPVNKAISKTSGHTYYENAMGFTEQNNDYTRLDLRIAWRKEKTNYTRTFSIDIQNVLSVENEGFQYYDFKQRTVVDKRQLGIIPVLAYRVEF